MGNEVTSLDDIFGDETASANFFDEIETRPYRPDDAIISDPEIVDTSLENVSFNPDDPLFSVIRSAEAPGDSYNRIQGTSRTVDLTDMTLAEIDQLQGRMLKAGAESTAVGAYQILRRTLRGLKRKLGLPDDAKFTKELQDQLAVVLARRRGLQAYLNGEITEDEFMDRLAQEWAGLPLADGTSYHAGTGSNAATISRAKLRKAIRALKEQPVN